MVALVEEDGTGLPTANSFLTVDEATEILEVNPHSLWAAIDPEVQANLLIWATRLLMERTKWKGTKTFENSGTSFPRKGLVDVEGNCLPDDEVPQQVKNATAYLADYLSATDPTTVNSSSNLKKIKADVVELEFDAKLTPARWPGSIKAALYPIGLFSSGRGPKFIIKY